MNKSNHIYFCLKCLNLFSSKFHAEESVHVINKVEPKSNITLPDTEVYDLGFYICVLKCQYLFSEIQPCALVKLQNMFNYGSAVVLNSSMYTI